MRILRELGLTALMCLAERLLERAILPGLHRVPGRMAASDPIRVDDLSTLLAETLALFALLWVFNGSLYAISYLSRRPLKPYAILLVSTALLSLIFLSSLGEYLALPAAAGR